MNFVGFIKRVKAAQAANARELVRLATIDDIANGVESDSDEEDVLTAVANALDLPDEDD